MCVHDQETAKYYLDYYLEHYPADGLTRFKESIQAHVRFGDKNAADHMKAVLDEHLHPEKVRAKAQSYIDQTNAKLAEAAEWAKQLATPKKVKAKRAPAKRKTTTKSKHAVVV